MEHGLIAQLLKTITIISGGSKGGAPPTAQKFHNFMWVFFGNFWYNSRLAPPTGGLAPLLRRILDPPLIISHRLIRIQHFWCFMEFQIISNCEYHINLKKMYSQKNKHRSLIYPSNINVFIHHFIIYLLISGQNSATPIDISHKK